MPCQRPSCCTSPSSKRTEIERGEIEIERGATENGEIAIEVIKNVDREEGESRGWGTEHGEKMNEPKLCNGVCICMMCGVRCVRANTSPF